MAIVVSWSGDGLSDGSMSTASAGTGDTAPTRVTGTAPVIETFGARPPSIAVDVPVGQAFEDYAVWRYATGVSNYAVRFYFYSTAINTGHVNGCRILSCLSGDGSTLRLMSLCYRSNRFLGLALGYPTETQTLSPQALALNTWYRIELVVSGTSVTAYVYPGESLAPVFSWSATITTLTTATQYFYFGKNAGGAFGKSYFDDIRVADSAALIGPEVPPPASAWYIWDGVAEQPLTLSGEWDGSAVQPLTFDNVQT